LQLLPIDEQPEKYVAGDLGAGYELAIFLNNQQRKSKIRMVAGFAEANEKTLSLRWLDLNQRPLAENGGWFLQKGELIGALSPLVRYGGNSGDSIHAETRFRTPCHYQIFF
jgi:hypothetical protein